MKIIFKNINLTDCYLLEANSFIDPKFSHKLNSNVNLCHHHQTNQPTDRKHDDVDHHHRHHLFHLFICSIECNKPLLTQNVLLSLSSNLTSSTFFPTFLLSYLWQVSSASPTQKKQPLPFFCQELSNPQVCCFFLHILQALPSKQMLRNRELSLKWQGGG